MSRSNYSDCLSSQELNLWRGAVERALRGKRGQAFLCEMRDALDAMPEKRLIVGDLVTDDGACCAMGAVALSRKLDVSAVDESEPCEVAEAFGLSQAMVQEIAYENDECGPYGKAETPEQRWTRMRAWVERHIKARP